MYYLLFYKTALGYKEKRKPYRKEHIELVQEAVEKGHVVLGGALENPSDQAVILFKCKNEQPIQDFIANDPYVQNGVVESWEIREWNVVVGKYL